MFNSFKNQEFIMKQFGNYFLILFMAIAITTTSCSKDDDSSNGGFTPGETMMTAKIDGVNFVAANTESLKGNDDDETQVVFVAGVAESGNQIIITIHKFTGSGTYTVSKDGTSGSYASILYFEDGIGWWGEDGGQVTVSGYLPNERIKGSFQFELNNLNETQKSVTDGKFEMTVVVVED